MKPSKDRSQRHETAMAALMPSHLLHLGVASHALMGSSPPEFKDLMRPSNLGAHINGLVPQKMMLGSVVSLLEYTKAGMKRALGDAGCVNEVAQGKEVMDRRLPGPEPCLAQAAQLILLRTSQKPPVENGYGQSVPGLMGW